MVLVAFGLERCLNIGWGIHSLSLGLFYLRMNRVLLIACANNVLNQTSIVLV